MALPLAQESHKVINFANGTYQWADVRRFQLPAGQDDQAVLAALTASDAFGDDYATGPGDDPARHGPYWRRHVTPDSYEAITADAAEQRLRTWAEHVAPLDDATGAALESDVFAPLRAAGAVFVLRDLGRGALHDWAGQHDTFHELVAVDSTGTLLLIVAAED